MSSNIRIKRICKLCGKEFEARTTVTQFCGDTCAKRSYKLRKKEKKIKASDRETRLMINSEIIDLQAREFLSITDATRLLGIGRTSLYQVIRRGEIKPIKIGRRTIIKRKEIDKLTKTEE